MNALRLPYFGRDHAAESPFWARAVSAVVRHRVIALTLGVLVLLAAAAPVLGLKTGTAGVSSLPEDTLSREGFEAVEQAFPRAVSSDPAQVVVYGDVTSS